MDELGCDWTLVMKKIMGVKVKCSNQSQFTIHNLLCDKDD